MIKRIVVSVLTTALILGAQGRNAPSGPMNPNQQPEVQALSQSVQALRRAAQLNATAGAQADKLLQDAASLMQAGQTGEARRKLANAQAVITGKTWDAKEEFAWSLAIRPHRLVLDPARPMTVELAQQFSAAYPPAKGLRVRLGLATVGRDSKPVREIGSFDAPARDFVADPLRIHADLTGVADGSYRLTTEVLDGDTSLLSVQQSIAIADGIELRQSEIERRLAKVQGRDSAKATVRWPFDMARVVNTGIRKLETGDFGLPENGTQTFDFAKELRESLEVLKALESGKDPLVRAKGDHERHYWFSEAGEIMPYRVYAPSNWDGKKQLPLILVLHGNSRDHNFYFDRDGGILAKLAEKHGYIVATTMGYRPNAGYNASQIGTLLPAGSGSNPEGGGRGGRGQNPAARRQTELSEKDAMNTLELVVKEFNPDPSRIFLFGHSAGGTGGWYFGSKNAERFAGIALSAFGTQPAQVPWDRLKGMPILVIIGSKDTPGTVERARTMAKAVKEKGFDTQFLEIPEATHDTIVGLALPTVYEFFSTHRRK